MTAPFRLRDDGVEMFVRLTPKTAMDRLEGIEISADGRSHLKARVRALPEKRRRQSSARTAGRQGAGSAAIGRLGRRRRHGPLKMLRVLGDPAALARGIEALSSA